MLARQLWRLGKHSAIYGLGAVVSRLIGLFLLPVVTRYLTRRDLGAVDTLIALSVVLVIVLRAGISMAFFRYYFDAKEGPASSGRPHVVLVHDGCGDHGWSSASSLRTRSRTGSSARTRGRTSFARPSSCSGRKSTTAAHSLFRVEERSVSTWRRRSRAW
jgi:hypothetical protein